MSERRDKLEASAEAIRELCEPVSPPKRTLDYINYFCARNLDNTEVVHRNEPRRAALYAAVTEYADAFSEIADEWAAAGYSSREAASIEKEVSYFRDLRDELKRAAGEETPRELVVLVAEDGTPVGTADKALVHDFNTPLHLAFSCHVFDRDGRILVTRRALGKKTWPGVWTNSFCGHPAPGETLSDAATRRASYELGIGLDTLTLALPEFRYRAVDAAGTVENEVCPVFTAITLDDVSPRADEVMEWRWVHLPELIPAVNSTPWAFSPWLTLQLPLLYPNASTER